MTAYQKKFEKFFKTVFKPTFEAKLFVIPATFTLIHKQVELATSCWLYGIEDMAYIKKVIKDFYIYYSLLKSRKNINMSTYVLSRIQPQAKYANFYLGINDYSNLRLIQKDGLSNNATVHAQCHDLSSPNIQMLWENLQKNKNIDEYIENLPISLQSHQLISGASFLDFNTIKINTIDNNYLGDIKDADFLLDNLLMYIYYSDFKYIYYIPTCLVDKDFSLIERLDKGSGIFVVCSSVEIPINYIDYIRFIIDGCISYAASEDIITLQKKANHESIKSAKAAIMSRNMSHNLGSHVMFYIKQKLQSVSKIVNNNVLHNIIPGNSEDINIKTITDKIAANKDVELPFLVGLGRFINYLQERQDYIATVATNYIPARSTISFKDFIYDELKPDLRYERHHKKDDPNSSSDNGWQPKNLLLDYIAYSEGYSKSDAIEIKFGEFDGHDPQDVAAETDFQALRKFNVAVPGGVIGRQAIFSIVENIIRNAAKHSEHRSNGKLVLQLSLVDAEKDFAAGCFNAKKFRCMRKEKGSMESGESLVKLYQNHKDAFHILRIKLDMPNKEEDIDAVVKKLGEDYVEEDGSMKETSKGLKEMRISAAWLRGHSIDTDIPTTEPPVLAVYSEPYKDDTDKETISYYLCIPKPCKVAFVVDKELLTYIDDNGKESSYIDLNPMLEPFGCAVFGYDDEAKQLNKKEQNDKEQGKENKYQISDLADYEIVCMLLDDDNDKKRDSIVPYISSRYITNRATTKSILDELKGIAKPSKGSNQEGKNNERQYAQIKTAIDSIYEKWLETAYPMAKNTKLVIAEKKNDDSSKKENSVLESDKNVMRTTTGNVTDEDCKDSVVYSTHFKGLAPDGNYEKMLSNAACIEAITGNNSTDRLIRQDEWTKEWKSKHLSAGLAKVAIFDERIFSTFITKEQGKTKGQGIEEKIKEIKDQQLERGEQMQKIIAAINQITNIEIDQEKAQKLLRDPDKVHQEIPSNSLAAIPNNFIWEHKTAQKNHERRIWAFDIRVEEKGKDKSVDIVGYNVSIENRVNTYIDHKTDAEVVIGNIEPTNNGGYTVKLKDTNSLKSGNSDVFDYISIHQGILDKIYGAFGIKENDAAKLEVTKAIHSCFSKHDTPDDAKDFLPRFIIHSGRSKPNEKDMPQHQPFVQFAAIDHAVKDCKYTLVELLATAHYESNNNN